MSHEEFGLHIACLCLKYAFVRVTLCIMAGSSFSIR